MLRYNISACIAQGVRNGLLLKQKVGSGEPENVCLSKYFFLKSGLVYWFFGEKSGM
jgi:hypothetical protein